MENLKKYIWKRMIDDVEHCKDEKLLNNLKAFKSKEDLIKYIKFYSEFGFDDMKRINSFNRWMLEHKYHVRGPRLLGNKTKAMPDKVYRRLIDYVGSKYGEKQKLALEFEGIEGARGEDTVQIKKEDIDFEEHVVKIINRKEKNRIYEVPLNKELESELRHFMSSNSKDIDSHKGFIFYSKNNGRKTEHISQKYLKRIVYESLKVLGLNKVYTKSIDGRNLYLYSLHSLRGHAATRIDEKSGHDLKKVQELLDHSPESADVTLLYIERNNEKDLKGII